MKNLFKNIVQYLAYSMQYVVCEIQSEISNKLQTKTLRTANRQLPTAYCLLPAAYCQLPTVNRLLQNYQLRTAKLLTTILLTAYCQLTTAQTYPVQVNPQLVPPYSLKLSDYQTTSAEKLFVNLLLTDTQELGRQVRLKMYIEGQGLNIQTIDFVAGATPLFLDGGINQRLSNLDLRPYFNPNNLVGLTPQQYNQALPDGRYNFCFEVYDFLSGQLLSRKSCFPVYLILNDPPILNVPNRGDLVTAQNPQNIIFNWTPRHLNATGVQYEFTLKEIWDTGLNPQAAFLSSPPLHQETTFATTLLYGPANTQLLEGKTYGWQVRALVSDGISETSVFRNNGYSEIYHFKYEGNCDAPSFLLSEAQNSQTVQITWQFSNHLRYEIQYRKKGYGDEDWFSLYAYNQQSNIHNLEAGTIYEFRVGGECTPQGGFAFSAIHEFTMPTEDETAYYNCGIPPEIEITNQSPLQNIGVGETFTASDFPVVIGEVTGSSGSFSGWGYITIPFLEKLKTFIDLINEASEGSVNIGKYTRVKVIFNNIGINTDYQLTSGFVETEYDPDWKSIIDADQIYDDVTDTLFGDDGKFDEKETDIIIDDIYVNDDGDAIVTDAEGNSLTLNITPPAIITDGSNPPKKWQVDEDGNVTPLGEEAEGGALNSSNTNGASSGGNVNSITATDVSVLFSNEGFYSSDQLRQDIIDTKFTKKYETIPIVSGGNYNVLYKAISDIDGHTEDFLTATATLSNGKTTDDIVFKTKEGVAISADWNENTAIIPLKKRLNFAKEQIIATVKPADSTANYDIAGKTNIWHLKEQQINVTLVKVNGASVSESQKETIKSIYNKVGVKINFSQDTSVTIPESVWGSDVLDIGDSNLLNYYTSEEKAIFNYYKQEVGIVEQMYYVFLIGDITTSSPSTNGFMPLKSQYGFVFNDNNLSKYIAHELGHGIFGLKHSFKEYDIPQGTTDLLMDYGSGTAFTHMDWQKIHAPGLQLYLFQSDEDGEFIQEQYETNILTFTNEIANDGLSATKGIEPSGKIIKRIKTNDENTYAIASISNNLKFLISGISVYSSLTNERINTYRANKNSFSGFIEESTGKNFVSDGIGTIEYKASGLVRISTLTGNGCNYYSQDIQWDNNNNSEPLSVNALQLAIETLMIPNAGIIKLLYNARNNSDCNSTVILADIIENDASSECQNQSTIETDYQRVLTKINNQDTTQDELVSSINNSCLNALRKLSYTNIITAFRKLANASSIGEGKEIAILRLMTVIKSEKYEDFFSVMKENNNAIYLNLIDRMHNSSIYYYDGNNLSTFIDVLMYINYHSNLVDERAYLLDLLIAHDYTNPDVTSEILSKVFNNQIKISEKQAYFTALKVNNYQLYIDYLSKLNNSNDISNIETSNATLSDLIVSKGSSTDIFSLSDIVITTMNNLDDEYQDGNQSNSNSLFYKKKASLISALIQGFPSDKQVLYNSYKANNFEKFIYYSTQTKNSEVSDDKYLKSYINGFSKLIDETGVIADKMALVNWAVDNSGSYSNLDFLLSEILTNITTNSDKQFIYNQLSGGTTNATRDHELFRKTLDVMSGSDYLPDYVAQYSTFIANQGEVQDRIDLINAIVYSGDDWSFLGIGGNNTENKLAYLFHDVNDLNDASKMITGLKGAGGNYSLFKDLWVALDGSDNQLSFFVNQITNWYKIAHGNDYISIVPSYETYSQIDYLDSNSYNQPITQPYIPFARANIFNNLNGVEYDLNTTFNTNNKKVNINLEVIDDINVLDENYDPLGTVVIHFIDDTKVNNELTFKKGEVIAVPAIFVHWLKSDIDWQQTTTVIRVSADVVVVVISAAAAASTGGLSLAVQLSLSVEIVSATTDGVIAIYGDDIANVLGSDFVETLEFANIVWSIANLPSAIQGIPTLLRHGKQLPVFLKNITLNSAGKVSNFSIDFVEFLNQLPKLLENLNQTSRLDLLNKTKSYLGKIKFKKNTVDNPSDDLIKLYENTTELVSKISLANYSNIRGLLQQLDNNVLYLFQDALSFCNKLDFYEANADLLLYIAKNKTFNNSDELLTILNNLPDNLPKWYNSGFTEIKKVLKNTNYRPGLTQKIESLEDGILTNFNSDLEKLTLDLNNPFTGWNYFDVERPLDGLLSTPKQIAQAHFRGKHLDAWLELSDVSEIIRTEFSILRSYASLSDYNLFQNIGDATKLEIAIVNRYTASGNIVLNPMRGAAISSQENVLNINNVNFNEFQSEVYKLLMSGLQKLRATNRLRNNATVYRGRSFTETQYNALFSNIEIDRTVIKLKGFQSASESIETPLVFLGKTEGNYEVVFKIQSKNGVFIDDIADYGTTLGPIHHPNVVPAEQVQLEVLLEEGKFLIKSNPTVKTHTNGQEYIEIVLEELGESFRTID